MNMLEILLEDFYTEDIEKHDELNPKLFLDNKLKPEVLEKINQIVDFFLAELKEDEIDIDVEDIILVGSNVSYNYTKDSDLDIHIIANTDDLNCPKNLYPLLYSAYKSIFNKKMNIDFYGIPVEVYIECDDTPLKSNGIYSVVDNDWIKEPDMDDIPEVDFEAVESALEPFVSRYEELKANPTEEAALQLIQDIYDERKAGLAEPEGEYSIRNLVFKEFRNRGYLDDAKDLRYLAVSKDLSLESLNINEDYRGLSQSDLYAYRKGLQDLVHAQVKVFTNGRFTIEDIREQDVDTYLRRLKSSKLVKTAHKVESKSKFDFNNFNFKSGYPRPGTYYIINGELNLE